MYLVQKINIYKNLKHNLRNICLNVMCQKNIKKEVDL